jgi:hypothetical protein
VNGADRGSPRRRSARGRAGRELLFAWLHLVVLWSFAFAWPLFEVLQDSPEFFVARGNTSGDIILLALAVTLVPPTLLVLCELILVPAPRVRRLLHVGFVAVLIAAIVLQVIGGGSAGAVFPIALSVALGTAGGIAYARTRIVPTTLSVLSPAPFAFLVIFLLLPPVSKLVLPQDEEAAASSGRSNSTPVVVLVLDEFSGVSLPDRQGRVDADLFPNLAALARDATWYRNATTVADETTQAVPAILSGLRPNDERLTIAADYPQNLFTALSDGHSLRVSEPVTDLCPEQLCGGGDTASTADRMRALFDDLSVVSAHLLLPEDLRKGLPAVDRAFAGFRQGDDDRATRSASDDLPGDALSNRPEQVDRFLRGVRHSAGQPRLNFLHLALPHTPWQYIPSGKSYRITGPEFPGLGLKGKWTDDSWLVTQSYQRYLLQAGYADRVVGQLLRRLRRQRLYDRALVVVTADHGISFQPNQERRAVNEADVGEIANVPLFVKAPGQRKGRIDDRRAETIDILPTIAGAVNVRLRDHVDGTVLSNRSRRGTVRLHRAHGGEFETSFDEFIRRRDAEVQRRLRLFGAAPGFAGVFAGGPARDLIGRPPSKVLTRGRPRYRVEFDARPGYSSYDRSDTEAPVFVTGRLVGTPRSRELVAIAVNGRIVAVTRSYEEAADVRMGAMVPATAFREGANTVEALAVSGSRTDRQVVMAGQAETRAVLVRKGAGPAVKTGGGATIPIRPAAAKGRVERVSINGQRVTVTGWATDPRRRHSADRVLLFVGGRLVQAGAPSFLRLDLVKRFGLGVARAGYEFAAAVRGRIPVKRSDVQVIAIAGSQASELPASAASRAGR